MKTQKTFQTRNNILVSNADTLTTYFCLFLGPNLRRDTSGVSAYVPWWVVDRASASTRPSRPKSTRPPPTNSPTTYTVLQ